MEMYGITHERKSDCVNVCLSGHKTEIETQAKVCLRSEVCSRSMAHSYLDDGGGALLVTMHERVRPAINKNDAVNFLLGDQLGVRVGKWRNAQRAAHKDKDTTERVSMR